MKIFFERRPTLMGQTSFSSVDPGQRRVYSDLEILEDFLGKPSKLNHCKNGFFLGCCPMVECPLVTVARWDII